MDLVKPIDIATHLIASTNILIGMADKTIPIVFWPDDRVYIPHADHLVETWIETNYGPLLDQNGLTVERIMGHAKRTKAIQNPIELFNNTPSILPLNNCLYDVLNEKAIYYDSEEYKQNKYYFTYALPVDYNPDAQCPEIMHFYETAQRDVKSRYKCFQWDAKTLFYDQRFKKAMINYGSRNSAKSTRSYLNESMLGRLNVAGLTLAQLEDSWACADLEHKLANISPEVDEYVVKRMKNFKAITGYDLLPIEQKFCKRYFNHINTTLSFNVNTLPELKGDMEEIMSWCDRVDITYWIEDFGDNGDKTMRQKITTSQELSGYLNLLLPILHNIITHNKLFGIMTAEEVYTEIQEKSNVLQNAISDMTTPLKDSKLFRTELRSAFKQWQGKNKSFRHSPNDLYDRLRQTHLERPLHGKYYFEGLSLKEEYKPKSTDGQQTIDQGVQQV